MSTAPNPLIGSWPNPGGANPVGGTPAAGTSGAPTSQLPTVSNLSPLPSSPFGNPGNLANPGSNIKDIARNAGYLNVQKGQMQTQLAPQWAQLMTQLGGSAGNFFQQLMNLGSPFYAQKQQQSFGQGVQQEQNAAAQSRQQLQASGAGYTPSGTGAAMFGGEAQAAAGNQAETFINNLFQNEQLQTAGATGAAQVGQMFNPAQLFTTTPNPGSTQGQTPGETMAGIGSLMSGVFGGK